MALTRDQHSSCGVEIISGTISTNSSVPLHIMWESCRQDWEKVVVSAYSLKLVQMIERNS